MFLSEPSTLDIYTKGITFLVIVVTSRIVIKKLSKMQKLSVPVEGIPMAPHSNWLIGHTHLFLKNFKETWSIIAYENANDEGVSSFWIFSRPAITVNTVEHARAILSASSSKSQTAHLKRHGVALVGNSSLPLTNGKVWGHTRAIYKNALSSSSIDSMLDDFYTSTASMVKSLDNKISRQHEGRLIEMNMEQLNQLMLADIFGKSFFGLDLGCCEKLEQAKIIQDLKFLVDDMKRRMVSPLNPAARFYNIPTALNRRHKQSLQFVRKTLGDVVDKRKHALATTSVLDIKNDFITSLLKSGVLHIDAMINNLITVDIAAFDATTTSLNFIFYCIATHTEVEKECLNEIYRELEESNGALNHEKLVYCNAVVKETVRLNAPIVRITRSLERPYKFKDTTIKTGTTVIIPAWHIQRDERHFHRAEEFLPERWVKHCHDGSWVPHSRTSSGEKTVFDEEASSAANHVRPAESRNFISFSAGGRSCVGYNMSMKLMCIIMVELIRHFKFEVKEGFELNVGNDAFVSKLIGGIPMVISKRDM